MAISRSVNVKINVDNTEFSERVRNMSDAISRAGFSMREMSEAMHRIQTAHGRTSSQRFAEPPEHVNCRCVVRCENCDGTNEREEPKTTPCVLAPPNRKITL